MATDLFDQPKAEPMTTELVERPMTDPTPMGILADMARDPACDPERLRAIMDLQERWERNQAEKQFAEAMHAAQQEMPKVIRDAANKQTNSRYALLESVQEKCRPVYSQHGFSLCYGEADCPVASFKRTVCDVTHTGGHSRRYHLDLPMDGVGPKGNPIGGMNAVQGCISTTSYGQRRLLCMIFNVTIAGEDDDGQTCEKVTDEHIATLQEWIATSGADVPAFLNFLGVEKLPDIPLRDFGKALNALKRKDEQQRGKK